MRALPPRPPTRTSSIMYHDVRATQIHPESVYASLTQPITHDPSGYLDSTALDDYSSINSINIDDNTYENIITGYQYSSDEYEN